MAQIIMYTSEHCSYCVRAKDLLNRKHLKFTEIRVDLDDALRDEMIAKSGRRTVPQIFINGQSIGGCDDLYALDKQGQLNQLLEEE